MILSGRTISDKILKNLKKEVSLLPFQPIFCDVLVGINPISKQYVQMKEKRAESIGIQVYNAEFPDSITTELLINEINSIAIKKNMCGLIIQLPLPEHIDSQKVLDAVPPEIDVDVVGSINSELFYQDTPRYIFPTAGAVMELLEYTQVSLLGKNIVVAGHGFLVGKPVTHLLKQKGFSVTTVTRSTENSKDIFRSADIIISATGQKNLITGDVVKEGVIIIDAGTSELGGAMVGDVDRESVEKKATWLSPVPGGVGPVTVAKLLENVVESSKNKLYK